MSALDLAFFAALILAAMAAASGGRAASALVISNMALTLAAYTLGFIWWLWVLTDLIVIGVIIVPGLLRWGGVTRKNFVICVLFPVAWRFYMSSGSPEYFVKAAQWTSVIVTVQLLLSLPWGKTYDFLRCKILKRPPPPPECYDEMVRHGG